MTGLWNDFNSAQSNGTVIPKGTLAKVRLTIRPGGFDDPSQGWTDGYAKRGATGAVYLDAEYTVVEGAYAKRKIWSLIGLYSPKGPDWGNAGRGLIKGILNSARCIDDKDNSSQAQAKRRISGFAELDGIEFIARMDIGSDTNGEEKNEVRSAVTPTRLLGLPDRLAPQVFERSTVGETRNLIRAVIREVLDDLAEPDVQLDSFEIDGIADPEANGAAGAGGSQATAGSDDQ